MIYNYESPYEILLTYRHSRRRQLCTYYNTHNSIHNIILTILNLQSRRRSASQTVTQLYAMHNINGYITSRGTRDHIRLGVGYRFIPKKRFL